MDNKTLMTDFYELTMAQTYFNEGKKDETPKTGAMPIVLIAAIVSTMGLLFIRKERKIK